MPSAVKVPTAVICVAESLVTESAGTIAPVEDTKSTCTPVLKLVPTIVKVVASFVVVLGEIEVKEPETYFNPLEYNQKETQKIKIS